MNKNKLIFFTAWTILLLLAPVTIFQSSSINEAFKYPVLTTNFFQRLIGLWAFTLMFVQVVLGTFMGKLTERYGGWIYSFHIFEGILVYFLILLHPLLFVVFNYFVGTGVDPFYVFTQFCVVCRGKTEFYYTLGRVSFWLLTLSVAAAFFRTSTPFLRKYWKKFHIINFLSFVLIGFHSIGVGTDIGTLPFSLFHGPALAIGIGLLIYEVYKLFFRKKVR